MSTVRAALAVTWTTAPPAGLARAEELLADGRAARARRGDRLSCVWVPGDRAPEPEDQVLLLAPQSESRGAAGRIGTAELSRLLDAGTLPSAVDPPCGLLRVDPAGGTVAAVTDQIGFRHLYVASGHGWAAVSTSARSLAALTGRGLDVATWGLQSLLGWQAGRGSAFSRVTKTPAGSTVTLVGGHLETHAARSPLPPHPYDGGLDDAVRAAAAIVRRGVTQALDDHPGLLLQLTGGLDSRILLAAIPPQRRPEVACLTLVVPGSADAELAAGLTARFGMRHHLLPLDAITDLGADEARSRAEAASRSLDAATDPLALAVLREVEGRLGAVPRLSGLGGEVVRGFYYLPAPLRGLGRDHRVARLARWRMFPNEEVPDEVIHPRLREDRRMRAVAELQAIFAAYPEDWNAATDHFYLDQRMQRWAGVLASASSVERVVVNPMLDPEFLALGTSLPTRWKADARFLSRLLCELDPALAELPLDGRPAPRAYAYPGWRERLTFARLVGHKVVGKVNQRLSSSGRAPAGGVTLGDRVVDSWRQTPQLLDGARALDVVDPSWLDGLVGGAPAPASAVALLTNLTVAAETLDADPVSAAATRTRAPAPLGAGRA